MTRRYRIECTRSYVEMVVIPRADETAGENLYYDLINEAHLLDWKTLKASDETMHKIYDADTGELLYNECEG